MLSHIAIVTCVNMPCVCVPVCMCVHMCLCVHVCAYVWACVFMCVGMCVHVCGHVCAPVCMYVHVWFDLCPHSDLCQRAEAMFLSVRGYVEDLNRAVPVGTYYQ